MKKQFKLPKEFGEKWLQALRSGDYMQGEETLMFEITKRISEETEPGCYYCCLGVAGKISGIDDTILSDELVLTKKFKENFPIPSELIGEAAKNKLVNILTGLNDGITNIRYKEHFTNVNYVFRHGNIHDHDFSKLGDLKLNFNQIADFIEDNCEFYETNVNQEL